ncbi:helix-turn-helix domain-containing protein [Prosthecobacter sp.]|uniref:helix-turn-helix domain-containing protein n=1 Tax=Prosthecobacter sp. TaxID=1965333 RepID=UPI003783CE3B
MLRETDRTLADIAIETGWCDQSAFTRHFSRYAGMAPGKFRGLNKVRLDGVGSKPSRGRKSPNLCRRFDVNKNNKNHINSVAALRGFL